MWFDLHKICYNNLIMMYDNFYPGRHMGIGGFGPENFFGPGWLFGMALFGGVFLLLMLVSLALKGYALWHASKRNEKWWFIALLVINTFGILELVYLIFFAKVLFNKKCCKDGCEKGCCSEKKSEDK